MSIYHGLHYPMDKYRALLLDVWRIACRPIGIKAATAGIAKLLAPWMPIQQVLVQRINVSQSRVETVAVWPDGGNGPRSVPINYTPDQLQRLLAWSRQGKILAHRADQALNEALAPVVPSSLAGEVIVGPLSNEQDLWGLLWLLPRSSPPFQPEHLTLLETLLEPFAVALENDQRLGELTALREAAGTDSPPLGQSTDSEDLLKTLIGDDKGLQPVMERVELVAGADVPVLILGETGAGKEVIARAIHARSPRAAGPFIRVNCGAIPPELIDSELFGHERGSFTGAVGTHKGWFERATGGTLFLDELGELPPAAQVRLLHVLQDSVIERVGSERPLNIDVRIIAATHRDLAAMVQSGRFREDLWYRISIFPIELPPLREHLEDIPALARYFARRAAARFGLPVQLPSPQDIARLASYHWPGNVRELTAVIDRATLLGKGQRLEILDALGMSINAAAAPPPSDQGQPPDIPQSPVLIAPLDTMIRQHIEAALAATKGRIEGPHGAAELLRVNPHTLRARMRKLGIAWAGFRSR